MKHFPTILGHEIRMLLVNPGTYVAGVLFLGVMGFEYPGGRMVSFMCRQVPGTPSDVGNVIFGTTGTCHIGAGNAGSKIFDRSGNKTWEIDRKSTRLNSSHIPLSRMPSSA